MTTRRWRDLDPRFRRAIAGAAAVEGVLKVVALTDLARRPPAQVRGSKARWAAALAFVNAAGLVPAAYLRYGRRR